MNQLFLDLVSKHQFIHLTSLGRSGAPGQTHSFIHSFTYLFIVGVVRGGGGVVRGGGAWWSQCIGRYRPTLFVGAWLVYLPIGIYFREKDGVAAMGSIVAAMSVTAFFIPFPKNQFFLLIQQ